MPVFKQKRKNKKRCVRVRKREKEGKAKWNWINEWQTSIITLKIEASILLVLFQDVINSARSQCTQHSNSNLLLFYFQFQLIITFRHKQNITIINTRIGAQCVRLNVFVPIKFLFTRFQWNFLCSYKWAKDGKRNHFIHQAIHVQLHLEADSFHYVCCASQSYWLCRKYVGLCQDKWSRIQG